MGDEYEFETVLIDIMEFLEEYEKFPCLWDKNHKDFKDRKERLKCEEMLGAKLGVQDIRALRRKIRSVRGAYNTEIRKLKLYLDNGIKASPKLYWFPKADKFLRVTTDLPVDLFPLYTDPVTSTKRKLVPILPRKSGITIVTVSCPRKLKKTEQDGSSKDNDDSLIKEEIVTAEDYEDLELLDEDELNSHDADFVAKFDTLDDLETEQHNINSTPSKANETKEEHNESPNLSEIATYLKDIATENEFAVFGRSIGMQLQNMPLELAVKLQNEIQERITKTRLEYLQQSQNAKATEIE